MARLVMKFGGTSVADVDRIRNVVGRIARTRSAGHGVVAVVSAMAGETNRLLALARAAAKRPDERETDALLASGEQVTEGGNPQTGPFSVLGAEPGDITTIEDEASVEEAREAWHEMRAAVEPRPDERV